MKVGDLSRTEVARRVRAGDLRWRTGPFVVRVRSPFREVADHIHFLYERFDVVEGEAIIDFDVAATPPRGLGRWLSGKAIVYVDGVERFARFSRRIVVPMLEWGLNGCLFFRPHQYLTLHSAVIERDGQAVLLPGHPGAGKSTLCAALVHNGWRLFSDEVALVRPVDTRVFPVPRPVGLKEESIPLIKRFAPESAIGPSWPGTTKGVVAHMRPPDDSVDRCDEPAQPSWVVFPCWQRSAPATLTPLSKARALMRVAEEAFNYSVLGARGFETLAQLIDQCDCYVFTYSDLNDALATFGELIPAVEMSVTS